MAYNFGRNVYEKTGIKTPWLIQRCTSKAYKPGMKSSEYLDFDYMGAAEFEWGALPAWQREMHSKLDKLLIRHVEEFGQVLYVMAEDKDLDEYSQIIKDVMIGKIQTKMRVGLKDKKIIFEGKNKVPNYDHPDADFKFDVWWDITNGLCFSRSIDVLLNLKKAIKESVKFMDSQNKGKK